MNYGFMVIEIYQYYLLVFCKKKTEFMEYCFNANKKNATDLPGEIITQSFKIIWRVFGTTGKNCLCIKASTFYLKNDSKKS